MRVTEVSYPGYKPGRNASPLKPFPMGGRKGGGGREEGGETQEEAALWTSPIIQSRERVPVSGITLRGTEDSRDFCLASTYHLIC